MLLILIRHAETVHNRDGLVQGRADNPLSELGREQAAALGRALARRPLTAVYSSPLRRAFETAQAVALPHGLSVTAVPDLIEMDIGAMEGLSGPALRTLYPEFMRDWLSDAAAEAVMPGGESLLQVQARAGDALDAIVAAHPAGAVAVVSHNFVLLTLLCRVLAMSLKDFRRLRHHVAAASIIDVTSERQTLIGLNDIGHLEQAGLLGDDIWERLSKR